MGIRVLSIKNEIETIKKITSTAELSFAFLLSAVRHLPAAQKSVRDGHWTWAPFLGRQVKDLTVGIVGLGRLGEMMAKYCASFGAKVRYIDPNVSNAQFERVFSVEKLFETCDVVSLHVHVKHDTREMINSSVLSFGKCVVLINTSRGEIVNEQDVVSAIESGNLSHYSTDVLADEFEDISRSPLLKLTSRHVTVTPHIGGSTVGAQSIAYHRAVDLLEEAK
jgi:D-3-phosphoglycerate dehydrogenase